MELRSVDVSSPLGTLVLVLRGGALCALDFASHAPRLRALLEARFADVSFAPARDASDFARPVRAYFEGDLGALDALPLDLGGSVFQRTVWHALRRVPAGATIQYGALAAVARRPGAARAVGAANARNPVALAVPCHRVVGADGSLTGYAGGLERKRWLLRHEGATL